MMRSAINVVCQLPDGEVTTDVAPHAPRFSRSSFVRVRVHVHQSAGGAPSSSTVPRPRARGNRQTSRRLGLYGSEVVKLTIFNNFVIGRIVKYSYARLGHLRPLVSLPSS